MEEPGWENQALSDLGKSFVRSAEGAVETLEALDRMVESIDKVVRRTTSTDIVDQVTKRIESLFLTLYSLYRHETVSGMVATIMLYVSTWCDTSLTKFIMDKVHDLLYPAQMENQAGWFRENWSKLAEGPFAMGLGRVMSVLIAVGLLPPHASTKLGKGLFEICQVRRFSDDGSTLGSLLETCAGTVDWVVDNVWPAVATGNMELLFVDTESQRLDESYRHACDVATLYIDASYEVLKQKYGIGNSGHEVLNVISECLVRHETAKKNPEMKFLRNELLRRSMFLDKMANTVQATFVNTSSRVRPFSFLLRGGSGLNKSGLANIFEHVIKRKNNMPEDPKFTCRLNAQDKYQSKFQSHHLFLHIDDIGNTRPEHEEESPLRTIIQFINNVPDVAQSAEAHLKGKKDINIRGAGFTTNTEDVHANYFSMSPSSIMSRFNIIVDVTIKPEAFDQQGKIADRFIGDPNPDMWDLKMYYVKVTRLGALHDSWSLVPYEHVKDVADAMEQVANLSHKWFAKQEKLVAANKALHKVPHCPHHKLFAMPCLACEKGKPCDSELEPPEPLTVSQRSAYIYELEEDAFLDSFENQMDVMVETTNFEDWSPVFPNFNPRDYIGDPKDIVEGANYIITALSDMREVLKQPFHSLAECVKSKLDWCKKKIREADPFYAAIATGAAAIALCFFTFQAIVKLEDQASIEDVNAVAMPAKIAVKRDNAYQKIVRTQKVPPEASMTATQRQFLDKCDASLMQAKISPVLDMEGSIGNAYGVAATPVGGGNWLFPRHVFYDVKSPVDQFHIEMRMTTNGVHKWFKQIVRLSDLMQSNSDFVTVYLSRGGCNYDMSKFFAEEEKFLPVGAKIQLLPKTWQMMEDGILPSHNRIYGTITGYNTIKTDTCCYYGVQYTLDRDTFKGLCGALVVATGNNPVVIGIHCSGKPNGNIGAASVIIQEDLSFQNQSIWISEKTDLQNEHLGVEFEIQKDAKWKSPIHWIPVEEDVSFEYLGQHSLPTSEFRSSIVPSVLCEKLEELGIPREHAGPKKTAETMARQKHLVNCAKLLPPLNPEFLDMAVSDFKAKLENAVRENEANGEKKFKDYVQPLSYSEALNGALGVPGFDPLPPNTAPGMGRTGPKWKLCIDEAIDQKIKGGCSRLMTQQMLPDGTWTEVLVYEFDKEKIDVEALVERLFTNFTDKVRPNVIFKCNLKDESLSLEKVEQGKLRVFAGAPMDLVIAVRMLMSPLNVLMTLFPTLFESAVGVNAQGKDWDFIGDYLTTFGEENVCGGDFKSYDMSMRPDVTLLAFDVLKFFLRQCDYPPDLLDLIDGLASEICFPIYEINGILAQIDGSNPSGHPLTVIINGFVNCLLMRYVYFAMHWKNGDDLRTLPPFHKVVKLLTYGDDNVDNVDRSKEKLFNHVSIARELALIGMTFTMPNKKDDPVPFMNFKNIDFLKRAFRVHEATGTKIGALDVNSIYKSLTTHAQMKGRVETEIEIMAANIANALQELWNHGPEVFEEHQAKFHHLKDITDGVHTIGNFWREVSHESCLERYEATVCAYRQALEEFGLETKFENQSEIFQHAIQYEWEDLGLAHFIDSCWQIGDFEQADLVMNLGHQQNRPLGEICRNWGYFQRRRRQMKRCMKELRTFQRNFYEVVSYPCYFTAKPIYDVFRQYSHMKQIPRTISLFHRLRVKYGILHALPSDVLREVVRMSAPRLSIAQRWTQDDSFVFLLTVR